MKSPILATASFLLAIAAARESDAHSQQTSDHDQRPSRRPSAGPPLPEGISTSDWSRVHHSILTHQHAVATSPRGHSARNPRLGWTAQFDGTSALIQPEDGEWEFGLELRSFGFEGEMQPVDTPEFGACGQGHEITYEWRRELSEWWVNDQRGFEHGFTVHERPTRTSDSAGAPLVFELESLGTLTPCVEAGRRGLSLLNEEGLSLMRYDGLVAFDAHGESLPAWITVNQGIVRIHVDESTAQYPVIVDPVFQEAYLKASNTRTFDWFGFTVAASENTIVVGAYGRDDGAPQAGAAYVFVRSGSSWVQEAYLRASNPGSFDRFGQSVAVSGDTIVVGAPGEDSSAIGVGGNQNNNGAQSSGAAYVFVRTTGSTWNQQAYLKASNTDASDNFGEAVAVSGDTVVVGSPHEASVSTGINGDQSSNAFTEAGAAYVFERSGATWTQEAYVKASNADDFDLFGSSVAVSGDTIVVGAFREDSGSTGVNGVQNSSAATNSGAAYVFSRSGSTWAQEAYLKASNTERRDAFGISVAVFGDTVVVGASGEDSSASGVNGAEGDNSLLGAGAAYAFVRDGGLWTQEAYLKASNPSASDSFGEAVAILGDTIVIGAFGES
ncbi:MAG: FG-GAP repeat protein, partial [Planctomycetota bacterium]